MSLFSKLTSLFRKGEKADIFQTAPSPPPDANLKKPGITPQPIQTPTGSSKGTGTLLRKGPPECAALELAKDASWQGKIKGIPHIFIEYVDGENLREWIADAHCCDFKKGIDIIIQFCHGMEHAHPMIHRDIKPENILMSKEETAKITDFGITRSLEKESVTSGEITTEGITTFGATMGTYDYMSPEQYEGPHAVDVRADIYCFKVCLYEMFCGRKPYDTASQVPASIMAKQGKRRAHEPSSLRDDIPDDIAILLKKCCNLKKEERYSSFEELRKELIRIYHGLFNETPPHAEIKLIELKADGLNNRAISYLDLGKEGEAANCCQEALREDPKHLEATFNYGYLRRQRVEIPDDVLLKQMQ